MAGAADVDRAVAAARAALDGPWGKTPGRPSAPVFCTHSPTRSRRTARSLRSSRRGTSARRSRRSKAELARRVEIFRFYASAIASIAGSSNPLGGSLLFYSLSEPVGVCAQIVPWNYPIMLATWKLAPALAAGCSVVLKPDPATPLTALRLAELAAEVGFPPGVVNVVPGDGPTDGANLV